MENRIKELIAVGASVTANCQPCLQYHVSKAMESGATEEEIAAAIETGQNVRKGAASKMDKLSSSLSHAVPSAGTASDKGCGCDS